MKKKFIVVLIIIIVFIIGSYSLYKKNHKILISDKKTNLMFNVNDKRNQQGLTYANGNFYIGFDTGNQTGEIVCIDKSGNNKGSTGKIYIGHAAGLAFREKNGHIYVANGGGDNLTHVYEVDFKNKKVINDINLEEFGTAALIAIDNDKDNLIISTSLEKGNNGNPTFTVLDFNLNKKSQFQLKNQGIPQGMECYKGKLYYYTNNKITCIDLKKGKIIKSFDINESGESEGLTVVNDVKNPYVVVGYNNKNRLYSVK